MEKDPIINCHAHIFTGDHVPPYLARTFIPWPWYYILHTGIVVHIFRFWNKGPGTIRFSPFYKKLIKIYTAIMAALDRLYPLTIPLGYYLFFFSFFLLYQLIKKIFPPEGLISGWINKLYQWSDPIFPDVHSDILSIVIVIIVFIFFETVRKFIFLLASLMWKVVKKLPGRKTKEMFQRYLNIGRYSFHQRQKTIFTKLKDQYPPNTQFVILPMDMDHMNAGQSRIRYRDQMKELADVKNMPVNKGLLHPFIFADPRRFVPVKDEIRSRQGDKIYFDWTEVNGKVKLNDCFIREYIGNDSEGHRFSGVKIYPALGYYPFDIKLLPLWKYCADNGIPVLTHCIKGVIFYRGVKKQDWNQHPLFIQAMGKMSVEAQETDGYASDERREQVTATRYIPLTLPQTQNVDFSYNFTNPLNFLCVLEEKLLRKIICKAVKYSKKNKNEAEVEKLVRLFGYHDEVTPMDRNLSNFKICLGHFGGDDEWKRYFEKERFNFSSQLIKNPTKGINFFTTTDNKPSKGKIEQLWKYTDWYSIICAMMLQYPNVYADISYILHSNLEILPLLKQTLANPLLRSKVLYGTDFFVVRNHKSDKNMLADMMGGLSDSEFNQIARQNPKEYLRNDLEQF